MQEKQGASKHYIQPSDYVIFAASSVLHVLNVVANAYISYQLFLEGHVHWFITAVILFVILALFTQIFSHVFFTYNSVGADQCCSPYLQHINARNGEDENNESVVRKEFLEIERQTVCPHSGYPDRLWTDKDLVEMSEGQTVQTWKKICSRGVTALLHLLHLGPVIRYIHLLKFRNEEMCKRPDPDDFEEKKIKNIEKYFCKLCLIERAACYSLRDVTLLRLFESLETAPQILLQMYMVFYTEEFSIRLLVPIVLGITQFSFCCALSVKYQRMPRQDRYDQTVGGVLTMTVYKMFLISYRVVCLAIFAALYRGYLILIMFTHGLIMLLWILYLDTSFSGTGNHEEIAFNFTVALLKIFTFVNVSDKQSRNRILLYHVCLIVENVAMSMIWYFYTIDTIDYGLIVMASIGGLYLLGVFVKSLYYTCCHPNRSQSKGMFQPEVSVVYKNSGMNGMLSNPFQINKSLQDKNHLLRHTEEDNTNDVIKFPSTNTTGSSQSQPSHKTQRYQKRQSLCSTEHALTNPVKQSTWVLGFIEQQSEVLLPPKRATQRPHYQCSYDTGQWTGHYNGQPVTMDTCSGYDSEVASILSSRTPIYENLVPKSPHHAQPIVQPGGYGGYPPLSRASLDTHLAPHPGQYAPHNPNNDSLSSSGVYSEEERKLNLKARMESDYDVIQDPISHSPPPHSPPDLTVSPDSEPDIYENLPCIIRQGQQNGHTDGLVTMQEITITGPSAHFDSSLEINSAPSNNQWELLKGSLNFAYGPRSEFLTPRALPKPHNGPGFNPHLPPTHPIHPPSLPSTHPPPIHTGPGFPNLPHVQPVRYGDQMIHHSTVPITHNATHHKLSLSARAESLYNYSGSELSINDPNSYQTDV